MRVFKDLVQGTPEWLDARLGMVTASEVECLLVNGKASGGFGAGAVTYMDRLIGERITGALADPFEGNVHTRRGHELEPVALGLYAQDNPVEHVGFIVNHSCGYSPDGMVGDDGLVEIKTKVPNKLIPLLLSAEFPAEHKAQVQMGLWVSEREWCDLVVYWPGMPVMVLRTYREEAYIAILAKRCRDFNDLLESRMAKVMDL